MFNENNEKNNPVNTTIKNEASVPNGDNIYNSEHYNKVDEEIRQLARDNFEESQQKQPKVVNTQKLDRIGSDLYNPPLTEDDAEFEGLKNEFNNYVHSMASGSYVSKDDFLRNDQGISMTPFFKGNAPTMEGLENTRTLNMHQGGNDAEFINRSKRNNKFFVYFNDSKYLEIHLEKEWVIHARYDAGILKTNQLPFTQERVAHIDVKDPINRSIDQMIADSTNVDKLRAESNPKLTYKGKVQSGKNMNEARGLEGEVFKHNVDQSYENTSDKWLVTTGAVIEKSQRPLHVMPDTNRSVINHQPIGSAAPVLHEGNEKRPGVRKPMKNQLGTDTVRNAGSEVPMAGSEMHKQGYRALPNERDVTHLRNHQSNLRAEYDAFHYGGSR